MATRGRWVRWSLVGVLGALLLGRWLAGRTADALWADALGAGEVHDAIAGLQLALHAIAFLAAAIWCAGNLYLVYRSIGSVQVPRRLGNLEIVETIPRRWLLLGALGIGVILAFALSNGTGDWWRYRVLLDGEVALGLTDPLLARDAGWYLFRLPWHRALHGYALLVTGVMLAVIALLYLAVGAIRWRERRVVVADLARRHLGVLLAVFAVVLFWGYRLEPAELVAGLEPVPYDRLIAEVRLPAARMLSGLALVVAGASLLWIWVGQTMLVLGAWGLLAAGSFVGHFVAPAFAAASRSPEERRAPALEAAAATYTGVALGMDHDTVVSPPVVPDAGFVQEHADDLGRMPVWDPFVVTEILNRAAPDRPYDRFFDAALSAWPGTDGRLVPVYLAVREVDLGAARDENREMDWTSVHGAPFARARGVLAMHAARVRDAGLPYFVPSLAQPDSVSAEPRPLTLATPEVWFAPAMGDFAVVEPGQGPVAGIRANGLLRRLALAWALQSPQLVTSGRVGPDALILVDRAIGVRLARYAPFARFGAAYPVVADDRLLWVAPGYVWGDGFPLAPRIQWRGRAIRYLRTGLVGVVDAVTGETAVYLLDEADPLSAAWGRLAPELVRPAAEMPPIVRAHLRYPDELFRAQLGVLRDSTRTPRTPEPFWWVGGSFAGDTVTRLRLRAVLETQVDARLAAVVEGAVRHGVPRLAVYELQAPRAIPGPSQLVREFTSDLAPAATIPGRFRLVPFPGGVVGVQSFYAQPTEVGGPPRLAEVVVGWSGAVGRGQTLAAALEGMRTAGAAAGGPDEGAWLEARRLFERLDAARRTGDWAVFGQAYEALRRLLGAGDSVR